MYILIVLIIAISTAASANTIELSCPAMIETKQEIIDAPSGWDISTSSPTQLDKPPSSTSKHNAMRIGFSGGHPSERAILAPDREIKSKKGQYTQSIWFFSKSEENWFICSYHNSVFELSKPLPVGLKQCSIKQNEVGSFTRVWCE